MEMKRRKVESPELVESHQVFEVEPANPLKNDVILRKVLDYLDTGTKDSYKTLKSVREVCKKWKEEVTPRFMMRSRIVLTRVGLEGYHFQGTKENLKFLNSLMTQTPKTSLAVSYYRAPARKSTGGTIHSRLKKNYTMEGSKQFWKTSENWVNANGHKFMTLTLEGEFREEVFTSLLYKWTTNLEELVMCAVGFSNQSIPITRAARKLIEETNNLDSKCLEKLKNLTVTFDHWKYREVSGGSKVEVEDAVDAAFNVLVQAKNLKSLSLSPTENLAVCFFRKVLAKDEGMLKHLSKLEVELHAYYITPLAAILGQLKLTNLKELTLMIQETESLEPVLESHGQKLEILTVGFQNCWITENKVFALPKLSNLQQFTCSFDREDFSETETKDRIMFNADRVIKSMPRLKCWKIQKSKWHLAEDGWHVKKIFETVNGQSLPVHTVLETLDFGCCFTEPETLRILTNAFVNIRDLTIWINSEQLSEFFVHLTTLHKLKCLIIKLSNSVSDFSSAVLNMENFKGLKELTLERHSYLIKPFAIKIANLIESHSGLAKCETLEILSFRSFMIDPMEFVALRKELAKTNPKLVVINQWW